MSLVKRLNDRGYGWNAARRAVIMTNNQGYSEAMTWAVSHFQDANFDSPIYFLSSAHVDQRLIGVTGELLRLVQNHVEDKGAHPVGAGLKHSSAKMPRVHHKGATIPMKKPIISTVQGQSSFKKEGKNIDQSHNNAGSFNAKAGTKSTNHSHPKPPTPSSSQRSPLSLTTEDNNLVKASDTGTPKNGSRSDRIRPQYSGGSMSSVEGSLSSRASVKKQIQRGKAKLGTQKN